MPFSILKKITNKCCRTLINKRQRVQLSNHQMSVIASNCNGALILHDLHEAFRSPFVNLYMEPANFVRLLQNLSSYQSLPLNFIATDKPYPVALLGDVTLYFVHYRSETEAREKWMLRSQRLNLDNLFVMMTERDGCTYADLKDFDALPYERKVVFTHKPYAEIKSAFYIKGFENQGQVGDLFAYHGWFGRKYYDQFDYVSWFNSK